MLFRLHCLLVPCIDYSALPGHSLFDRQTTQARLSTTKLPQPRVNLVHIAASPAIHFSRVCTAEREAWNPALAELVRNGRSRVSSQKTRDQGDSANHVLCRSHVQTGCRGWFIQLDHSSIFHRPFDGQIKHFKGTEENQGVGKIIRAFFVGRVFWQTSMWWAQMTGKEELWTGIPTVFQGYTVAVLLDAVRIRWDDNNGILLPKNGVWVVCKGIY